MNDNDCPIHRAVNKWGQYHQNQYGDNFRPCHFSGTNLTHFSSNSHQSSRHRRYEATPPSQVYFSHQHQHQDTSSHLSNPSNQVYQDNLIYPNCLQGDYQQQHNNYYVSYNTDKVIKEEDTNFLPEGTMVIKTLNKKSVAPFGLCLFDSGSTSTLINERVISHHVDPKIGPTQQVTMTQGTYNFSKYFMGEEISFPEFCKTCFFQRVTFADK